MWDASVWLTRPQQGQRVVVLHSNLVSPLFRSSRLHRGESVEPHCLTVDIRAKAQTHAIDILTRQSFFVKKFGTWNNTCPRYIRSGRLGATPRVDPLILSYIPSVETLTKLRAS